MTLNTLNINLYIYKFAYISLGKNLEFNLTNILTMSFLENVFNKGESSRDNNESSPQILTPGSESPQGGQIVINEKGDTETVAPDGKVTLDKPRTTEEPQQESSQNEIDMSKYNETVSPPLGSIPQVLEEGKSGATVFVATEKNPPVQEPIQTPQQEIPTSPTTTEAPKESNNERVVKQNYWENPDKIKENFKSFDEAMKPEDAERYGQFQSKPRTEDTGPLTQEEIDRMERKTVAISKKGQQSLRDQDAISRDLKGKNFSSSLSEIMPQDEAERYNQDLNPEKVDVDEESDEITKLHSEIDLLREEIAALREAIERLTNPTPVVEPEDEDDIEPVVEPPTPEEEDEERRITVVEDTDIIDVEDGDDDTPEEQDTEIIDVTPIDLERRERNIRRATIIAGVVTGVGTGLLITSTAALPVGAAAIGANLLTSGTDFVLRRNSQSLARRIEAETDQERKEVLEKRLARVQKIRGGIARVQPFIRGFMVGFGGSLAFRSLFMGGQSLIEHMGATQGSESIAATTHESVISEANNPQGDIINSDPGISNTGGGSETLMSPEPLTENVLTSNGRVDLPGSAWNGNLANGPAGNLPGGVENHSNFMGGVHEMAPHLAETALQNAGITRSALLENLGTSGTHRLLNSFVDAIQMGNPNPSLVDILTKMNTPGAQNLIGMIK